jgi:hypothetical protein
VSGTHPAPEEIKKKGGRACLSFLFNVLLVVRQTRQGNRYCADRFPLRLSVLLPWDAWAAMFDLVHLVVILFLFFISFATSLTLPGWVAVLKKK